MGKCRHDSLLTNISRIHSPKWVVVVCKKSYYVFAKENWAICKLLFSLFGCIHNMRQKAVAELKAEVVSSSLTKLSWSTILLWWGHLQNGSARPSGHCGHAIEMIGNSFFPQAMRTMNNYSTTTLPLTAPLVHNLHCRPSSHLSNRFVNTDIF